MTLIQTTIRVPHLRDGFIVAKVGIARQRDRFPLARQCANRRAIPARYPKASALGLIKTQEERGFSPWGKPSQMEATTP
jgi:hypothetical protein